MRPSERDRGHLRGLPPLLRRGHAPKPRHRDVSPELLRLPHKRRGGSRRASRTQGAASRRETGGASRARRRDRRRRGGGSKSIAPTAQHTTRSKPASERFSNRFASRQNRKFQSETFRRPYTPLHGPRAPHVRDRPRARLARCPHRLSRQHLGIAPSSQLPCGARLSQTGGLHTRPRLRPART